MVTPFTVRLSRVYKDIPVVTVGRGPSLRFLSSWLRIKGTWSHRRSLPPEEYVYPRS